MQEQDCGPPIIVSPNDYKKYLSLVLPNEMQILVISDPKTDKSSASLDVNIGQIDDPEDRCGLAHFLEHMLFLGTSKYPQPNEFSEFLGKNSGYDNAFTDLMNTNFYFDCKNNAFRECLDRFAQFFISPLFNEDCVEKEINAVDSEHQMTLNDDEWRQWQLFRQSALKGHPFSRYGGGYKKTLQVPSIRQDLIKFYQKYYSANLMKLVVYSNQSVDALATWVKEYFSAVSNNKVIRPQYNIIPFNASNMCKLFKIMPIKDEEQIEFIWILPHLEPLYKKSVEQYLTFLLGHEGENSLLSKLIDEGLATELVAYCDHNLNTFSNLGVQITLTEEGFEEYEKVCSFVFQYIRMMQQKGVQQWIFDEQRAIAKINFRFKENENSCDYTVKLSQLMQQYPINDILICQNYWEEFDANILQQIIDGIKIDNLIIYLSSQSLEEETNCIEEYFGTKYSYDNIPQKILSDFNQIKQSNSNSKNKSKGKKKILDLPLPNKFIPQCFDILVEQDEKVNTSACPVKILETDIAEYWLQKDKEFQVSKGFVTCLIYSNSWRHSQDIDSYVAVALWLELLDYYLKEMQYQALSALLNSQFYQELACIRLKIKGFNDSILIFLKELFLKLAEFNVEKQGENIYNIFYEKLELDYENYGKTQPSKLSYDLAHVVLLQEGVFSIEDKIAALGRVTYKGFLKFCKTWLNDMRFEWFFYGNFNKEQVISIGQNLEESLKQKKGLKEPIQIKDISQIRVNKLPENMISIFELDLDSEDYNPEEPNSSIIVYYQGQIDTPEYRLTVHILQNIIHEPFYGQLRTEQQLGYVVQSGFERLRGIIGFYFCIQSSTVEANIMADRIQQFIQSMRENLANMSEETVQQYKLSVLTLLTARKDNLYKEGKQQFEEIFYHTFMFERLNCTEQMLSKITKADLLKCYNDLFYSQNKRLEVHVICKQHKDTTLQQKETRLKQQGVNINYLNSIYQIREQCKLNNQIYVDYYAPKQMPNLQPINNYIINKMNIE